LRTCRNASIAAVVFTLVGEGGVGPTDVPVASSVSVESLAASAPSPEPSFELDVDVGDDAPDASTGSTWFASTAGGRFAQRKAAPTSRRAGARRMGCPAGMVLVDGRVCVDRYESRLVDMRTRQGLSPYYPPDHSLAVLMAKQWAVQEDHGPDVPKIALPKLPLFERKRDFEPMAFSQKGVVPQGYTSGALADRACKNAHKRLCKLDEWRTACRGQSKQKFPYGDTYEEGKCNVFREAHPAMILHGNASEGHTDPRLNLVKSAGKPLLRNTGTTRTCASRWGSEVIYDMVGNVDEWIENTEGTFVGGFYSRATREGCESSVSTHGYTYWDYSTGVRCCSDPVAR